MQIKCIVIGDACVGKTYFLCTYINGCCPETNVPTVFDNYLKNVIIGDEPCSLEFWDTSGLPDYDRLRPLFYDQTDVFLICFSVVDPVSFDNIKGKWFPEMQHYCQGIPFLIIGTKIDLRDDQLQILKLSQYDQRPITSEEGRKLAQELGAIKYVECSTRTQGSVENVFDETISALKSLKAPFKKRTILNKMKFLINRNENGLNKEIKYFIKKSQLQWIPFSELKNIKEIGKGGFSNVYSATFKNRTVALKEFFEAHDRSTFFLDEGPS
ncbi:Cell division control protein 42 [Gigaspora margarita]|uniref:Cell division control protein 42 n=1 Tax=Gigaspora margarita TaxID=4874 RepID=A0A8H4ARX1_GIGMA|nr:Cell division control protein 42 [Gigaspora margarita]